MVIPSYNTQDTISETLKALQEQTTSATFEIILVDCSEHQEVATIAARFSKVIYEHRSQRFNPGEGRNIGARMARGELLVFVDSDVTLAPHALDAAWKHFTGGIRIFGGALELDTRTSRGVASWLEHYFFNHESQRGRPHSERANLSSALMCFSKEVFLSEGGFKDIPRMQDTELTERLRRNGHKLYFCPDVLAWQTQDASLTKVLRKIYINGQNLYYIRYQPTLTPSRKYLFLAALPAITLAKMLRIIGRHLIYQSARNKLATLLLSPVLLLGGGYWMSGFYHALLTGKGIGTQR